MSLPNGSADMFFDQQPDFGFALPAFRAAKKPHYAHTATPKAKEHVLRKRRSSQSFGSSYGAYGEKRRIQEEEQQEERHQQRQQQQQQQQQQQLHSPYACDDGGNNNTYSSASSRAGTASTAASLPYSQKGGLPLARAPSRDFGSSTMHTTNSSVNATTDLFSEIPTAQLLQKQSAPPFHSNSNNNRTTPSSIHPFVLEKNALSRHTKRLKGKGTTSKPLRRSSSMGPLVALNKGKKNVGEGSSGLRNTFKRRRSTTDLTGQPLLD